jgi:CRISPR-associated protein Csx17
MALAGASGGFTHEGRPVDPVRNHWLPLDEFGRFKKKEKRLVHDVRVVARGRDPAGDLIGVVERRLEEAERGSSRRLGLVAAPRAAAEPGDLAALLSRQVDLERVVDLARALMALDWKRRARELKAGPGGRHRNDWPQGDPEDGWIAARIAMLPWPLDRSRNIPADPAIVRRLQSGDGHGAVEIAIRRLKASGIRPTVRECFVDAAGARLWAAALAFPITRQTALRWAARLDPALQERSAR